MYSVLRDAIVAQIKTVTDCGIVHNRLRYATTHQDYLNKFMTNVANGQVIQGWQVTWGGVPLTDQEHSAFNATGDIYLFKLIGIKGFQDTSTNDNSGSETDFGIVTDNVLFAVRGLASLNMPGNVVLYSISATVPIYELRMFGNLLATYTEIWVRIMVQQNNEVFV